MTTATFDIQIDREGDSYGSSPLAGLTDALTDYFGKRIGYVSDPWSQLAEGFLVRMHAYKPDCHVGLTPSDFGLDISQYGDAADYMRAGRIDLMEASIRSTLDTTAQQWRMLPKKWGVHLHWGLFVRLDAWALLAADMAELREKWAGALEDWTRNYDRYREQAEIRVRIMAEQAWRNAQQLGTDSIMTREAWQDMARFVDEAAARLMLGYPPADKIRDMYRLDYEQAIIPMPSLVEAQASWVEQVQVDKQAKLDAAKQQIAIDKTLKEAEYLEAWSKLTLEQQKAQRRRELVEEYARKTRQGLQRMKNEALRTFYAGYALQLRMRLYTSLSLVIEGIRTGERNKSGERKIVPQASQSLRLIVAELEAIRLDNDEEIEAMLRECKRLLGAPGSGAFTSGKVGQAIEDMGVVLQTSILALGGTPKAPRRMKQGGELDVLAELPSDAELFKSELIKRRKRLGDFESLGEAMIEGERLTPADLRRRRNRFEVED